MKNNLKIKMSTLFLANAYILSAASSKNPLEGGLTLIKNWVIPGALLFCVYNLVRAGLKMNGAVGEQEETQAKKAIKNNILGIAIIASAFFIINSVVLPLFSSGLSV